MFKSIGEKLYKYFISGKSSAKPENETKSKCYQNNNFSLSEINFSC